MSSATSVRRAVGAASLLVLIAVAMLTVAPAARAAATLSIDASSSNVRYGSSVTLTGLATPAGAASEPVVVAVRVSGGAWTDLATVATAADGSGAWSFTTIPGRNVSYRVHTADGTVTSDSVDVTVTPRVLLRAFGRARAFHPLTVRATVVPRTYAGSVRVQLDGANTTTTTRIIRIHGGSGRATLTPLGAGRLRLRGATTNARWATATAAISFTASGRTLKLGATGPEVRGLQQRLARLGFLTPGSGSRYTFAASEVTLAFQKAYGLPRTYVWGSREWRRLATLRRGPRPRYTDGNAVHVEVDKTRQLLFVARGSNVLGIFAVSTGATGNTPEGSFRIYQRGGSYLYLFMAFHGNFGIHGYVPVPAYPASHGCVREPNWAAPFTWKHTRIGTKVMVYA